MDAYSVLNKGRVLNSQFIKNDEFESSLKNDFDLITESYDKNHGQIAENVHFIV